jgi:hypothetical protein
MLALRIALDCHKEIFNQVVNDQSVRAVKKITERTNALRIEADNSNSDNNDFMR